MNIYIYICLLCGLLMTATNLFGQVTIGSEEKPKTGTILDLKEDNAQDANSKRGLLLPRVYLTNEAKLFPMLETNNEYINNLNNAKQTQDLLHSGLTVYNMNECFHGGGADKGVYVWNSTNWHRIGKSSGLSQVNTHSDQEGTTFKSRVFSTAGEWMIENVKAKKYASKVAGGAVIPTAGWKYPDNKQAHYDARPTMGLLYNWPTAMNSEDGSRRTQGVCPNGWHIPSDAEWNLLESEIYNEVKTYSNVSMPALSPTQWSVAWEASINTWRGSSTTLGHGNAMKAICPVPGITKMPVGNSRIINEGGFNALLTGAINFSSGAPEAYGSQANFWSGTPHTSPNTHAFNRSLSNLETPSGASNQVFRNASHKDYMMSIRCKLDDGFANCGDPLFDSEGNSYPTVRFGNVCWMSQNLRSKQGLTTGTDYVEPTTTGNKDEYGLLYTWAAATKSTASDILLAGEPGETMSAVSGICPDGWYIPSDADWTELEKEVAPNPSLYSTLNQTYAIPWIAAYDNLVEWRPERGNIGWGEFITLPKASQPTGAAAGGFSFDSTKGFAAIYTGAQQIGDATNKAFGNHASIWSSTEVFTPVTSDDAARYRGLFSSTLRTYRANASKTAKLSIRCIKRGV